MKRALLVLWLCGAAHAAPYSWSTGVAAPFIAPSDQRVTVEGKTILRGACLQGGLVDIRYGQVSIDLGGVAEVLDTDDKSVLTLDGAPISAEALLKRIPDDLSVVARYDAASGKIGWLDAYSGNSSLPAAAIGFLPWKGPAYGPMELLTLRLSKTESQRLGAGKLSAMIPGVTHQLPFIPASNGGLKATLRVLPGWDLVGVPIFIKSDRGGLPTLYRGRPLNFSTSAPVIEGFGPQQASGKLETIDGWIDLRSDSDLIDPGSIKLSVSSGARIGALQRRIDRTTFELRPDGPGTYWVDFSAADRLGRTVSKRWPITVLP